MSLGRDFYVKSLLVVTYTFIAGVIYGVFYPQMPEEIGNIWFMVALIGLGSGVGMLVLNWLGWRKTLYAFSVIGVIAFLSGWARYSMDLDQNYPNNITEHFSEGWEDTRIVEGIVTAAPTVDEAGSLRLTIEPKWVWYSEDEDPHRVDRGMMYLYLSRDKDSKYDLDFTKAARNTIYGDKIRFKGNLSEPGFSQRNPYGFDLKEFYHSEGIYASMYSEEVELVEERTGSEIVAMALNLQTEMLKVIKKTMPYPYSAFLGGATLGLREGLEYTLTPFETIEPPEYFRQGEEDYVKPLIDREFRGAGTYHVLAVSGLHVGVLAGAFWALFAGLKIPSKIYVPIIVVFLFIFTIITGARPSTQRAFIMTVLILLVFAYSEQGLRNSALIGLSAAALGILLWQPKLVFEASFTLSFTAVLCLLLITDPVDRILQKLRGLSFILFWVVAGVTTFLLTGFWNWFLQPHVYIPYIATWGGIFWWALKQDQKRLIAGGIGFLDLPGGLRQFIAAQFAVQIGMMWPLSAYYFLEYPYAGIYANLLAIPLVSIVVPLGLFAGLLGLIPIVGSWLALFLNAGNYLAVWLFMGASHLALRIFPYPAVRKFGLWHLLVFYSALGIFIAWRPITAGMKKLWDETLDRPFGRPMTVLGSTLSIVGVICFGSFWFINDPPRQVKISVLRGTAGGEAVALQTPSGSNLLFNGGFRQWDWHHEERLPDRRNDGRQMVSNFFLSQGIKRLDLFALQSLRAKRTGGAGYLTRQFVIDQAIGPLKQERLGPNPGLDRFANVIGGEYIQDHKTDWWFRLDYFYNWDQFWEAVQSKGIDYFSPREGTVVWDEMVSMAGRSVPVRVTVLGPPENSPFDFRRMDNNSLVMQIEIGGDPESKIRPEAHRILLPGDARKDAQRLMVESVGEQWLDSDVLLAPVRGSAKDSYTKSFFKAVDPEYVIATAEYVNQKAWTSFQEHVDSNKMYQTQSDNAIIIQSNGQELTVQAPFSEQYQAEVAGTTDARDTRF